MAASLKKKFHIENLYKIRLEENKYHYAASENKFRAEIKTL
jgi:hypothetical protein